MSNCVHGHYVVTGATGFLGQALMRYLWRADEFHTVAVSRNEGGLVDLTTKFPGTEVVPGDISDPHICAKALRVSERPACVDGIFHLAAFKHVGLAETNARQCIRSNTLGTLNLLDATLRMYPKPEFIIGISTDKAAQVHGVYGATKMLQERLFQEYQELNPETKYRTVRYGNVMYSTGSVLCKWKEQLQKGHEVILTNPKATRFYWSVDQAIEHIFECLREATDATPYVPKMKGVAIGVLLEAMMQKYGRAGVHTIGLQPGESLHEIIEEGGPNSSEVEQFTIDELLPLL